MRTRMAGIVVCVSLLGLLTSGALGEADSARETSSAEGKVFKLQYEAVPGGDGSGVSWRGGREERISKMPPGVDAKSATSVELDLRGVGFGRRSAVVVPSKYALYVDTNGDGKFGEKERIDIKRNGSLVRVMRSERDYHYCIVNPIKLVSESGKGAAEFWIAMRIYAYRGGCHVMYGSATFAAGKVAFGDTEIRLAIYAPGMSAGFGEGVSLSGSGIPVGSQLLLDVNDNGRFDRFAPYGMGPENRWLTRLVRLGGTYYELTVEKDGRSIRIAPTKPEVGKLSLPAHVESASVIGAEFATIVASGDKDVELPAGRYSIYEYRYNKNGTHLSARDGEGKVTFEIKAGQTGSFRVGAPLRVGVSHNACSDRASRADRRPREIRFAFEPQDCEGRQITNMGSVLNRRPPAPRLTILDKRGKRVLDAAFTYG